MISWHDLYTVLTAVIPLYVAMILAYGSVRWWKIFSPDQCSGINRFVAIFAVPLLSFHFISTNDPYAMNFRFIAADTLQKIIMLLALTVWTNFSANGSLEWMITIFSLSTLPNTLVMGIPLLIAMYGEYSGKLMVQVDSDVVSLDGRDFLETDAEVGDDGKLHVHVRKSNASRRSFMMTPRPSNLTGAEIYSLSSSRNATPRGSNFNHTDFYSMMGYAPRHSNFGAADVYSVQSTSRGPTPRPSNFEDNPAPAAASALVVSSPKFGFYPAQNVPATATYPAPNPEFSSGLSKSISKNSQQQLVQAQPQTVTNNGSAAAKSSHDAKELHMFVWSSSASPVSEASGLQVFGNGAADYGVSDQSGRSEQGAKEIRMLVPDDHPPNGVTNKAMPETEFGGEELKFPVKEDELRLEEDRREKEEPAGLNKLGSSSTAELHPTTACATTVKHMPPASVMTRLILIMVWRKLIRNPNTYSSLIGVVWSLVAFRWHVHMPKIIEKSISILSDAGLGMAMFSLGLFMALQPKMIACGNSVASFAMAVRFLTGPAVMAAASIAVGLRGNLLRVAIVQAALPQGIVPFVFAKEYNVHPAILSTGVIFGMLIALPITLVYYILLGL
ncbi:unnamed protein product [Vicia faba]|uniref:Auxin efflux carrier component n=1 Tax=Vicia faba TaxID=3906 RepID=A0AAV1B5R8_VICFA|nr:unnamed protein product [Vicia faba]